MDNQALVLGEGKGEGVFQLTGDVPISRDHRATTLLRKRREREHHSDGAKDEEQEGH